MVCSKLTGGQPLPWPSPPEIGPPDRFLGLRPTASEVYRDGATNSSKPDYVNVGGAALRLKKIGDGALAPEYTHFDAQGSAIAASDAGGSDRPFGRMRLEAPQSGIARSPGPARRSFARRASIGIPVLLRCSSWRI